jgi:hypothetical protein
MVFYVVSRCNVSWYLTLKLCMQCLNDLIILLVGVESIFKNQQSAIWDSYFRQSLKSEYSPSKFLPACLIQTLWISHCRRLWSLPKMNISLFAIWATLHSKLSSKLGRLQSMKVRSAQLLGIILDMWRHGDSIYTAELRTPAALASFVLFIIKFFTLHQNIWPAQ